MRGLVVALCLTGCFFKPEPPGGTGDGSVLTGGVRKIVILRKPTSTLSQFPLSVYLENDLALAASAAGAENIAFRLSNGAPLPCEIVSYDPPSGSLEAWVQAPQLPLAGGFDLELVYGPTILSSCAAPAVWSGYRGVWHFAEDVAGSSADSSVFKHDVVAGSGRPQPVVGRLGRALYFRELDADGADETCLSTRTTLDFGTSSFSYDVWVNPEALLGAFDIALIKGATSAGVPGFDLELGLDSWTGWIRDSGSGVNNVNPTDTASALVGMWSHLFVVVDRQAGANAMRSYLNGILTDTDPLTTGSVNGTEDLCFGTTSAPMRGSLDEVRLHETARSADWIRTSYENIALRTQFMRLDPVPL